MAYQNYALTYPQLIIQSVRKNYNSDSLIRLRRAHEAALRLLGGFYRAQDTPFICHVIRTASIVMEHGGTVDTVLAALLHAVYMFGIFRDGKVGGMTTRHRKEIEAEFGPVVEDLVFEYMRINFHDTDFLKNQLENRLTLSVKERELLFIALSNELEDFLDLQMVFRSGDGYKELIKKNGPLVIDLARVLNHSELAVELEAVFEEALHTPVPALAKIDRQHAYELAEHFRMRRGRLRIFLSNLKRRILRV